MVAHWNVVKPVAESRRVQTVGVMSEVRTHDAVLKRLNGDTVDYCRDVIQYFDCTWADTVTVDDLTAYIYAKESSKRDDARIRIRLHHATLPTLETSAADTWK